MYIDPGSGSFVVQMLLAFLLGVGMTLKLYWQKIKGFFSKLFGRNEESPD